MALVGTLIAPATAPVAPGLARSARSARSASGFAERAPSDGFEHVGAKEALAACGLLGLHSKLSGRSRVARRGAPPKPIWQTNRRSAVARLERQWLLSEPRAPQASQESESKEDLPKALIRFLGGSVLMAVLAQAFLRRDGSGVHPMA
ncbi:unnamed protein product [Effrenium voratum]|uniref:Uncharacterized protein n=1 Tax=Effrenium voratum TaxID=2562239 RepID=A0AA36HLB8_9DINO|nr:unnamed protein product [Effrenium voratum]CAJ1419197.1 unnamed protein product [Effrenium voratum]